MKNASWDGVPFQTWRQIHFNKSLTRSFSENMSTLKGINLLEGSKFFCFRVDRFRMEAKRFRQFSLLKEYQFREETCSPDYSIILLCHYENKPIQVYWKFYNQKIENFQIKILIFFLFLLKNIDCGYSLEPPRREAVLTSIHNLCFEQK